MMGRTRKSNLNLPPRMHMKGDTYYYVTSTVPRKWIKLSKDYGEALAEWARIEGVGLTTGLFSSLVARYLKECLDDKAANTRKQYTIQANVLVGVFGKTELKAIKPPHIAQYLDSHPKKNSANNEIALMSAMMEKALRWGWIDTNPVKGIRRNKVAKRDRYITDDEFTSIRAASADYIKVMMDIAYLTGARITDIINIKMQDITDDGMAIKQKKTGKRLLYACTPELSAAIAAAKELGRDRRIRTMFLICNKQGRQVKYNTFREIWSRTCAKLGIENAHFHDIRVKCGTDAKKAGEDFQAILGHQNRATSEGYVKSRETDIVIPHRGKL